jgi:ACS family allantoate permease-like MFS transporter
MKWTNARAIVGMLFFVPTLLGCFLAIFLPSHNTSGLLTGIFLTGVSTPGFVISLAWLQSTTAGHTKRTTAQVFIFLLAFISRRVVLMFKARP